MYRIKTISMAILEVDFFLFWGLMVSDIHRRKKRKSYLVSSGGIELGLGKL